VPKSFRRGNWRDYYVGYTGDYEFFVVAPPPSGFFQSNQEVPDAFVKEQMKILGLTAQQIVMLARSRSGSSRGTKNSRPAHEIAKGVMGRVAWDDYSNSQYKEMKGARNSAGRGATT